VSEEKQEYLNYLKEKCPIHNQVVDKHMLMNSFTTKSWRHLQVKSMHPTVTTNDGIPFPAHFLAAKIATIGGKTHDILPFAEGTSRERYYAYITMTCLESIIHQLGTTRLIFDRTGDDSIGSSYGARDQLPNRQAERYSHRDQIPYRQAERYPHPAAHGRMTDLNYGHSFPQHPIQPVMYQNQYQNSNLYYQRPLVQNDNRIVHTNFGPHEHYHNGMTNYNGGADGFQNGIPTVPFHLRNFHINSRQHEPIPNDNAVLDDDDILGTAL